MNDPKGYILGQSERAARRLEIQDHHFGAASEQLLDELAIRPRDRVVELGCGAGSLTRRVLARLGSNGVVVGVDTTAGLLEQAKIALAGKGPARFEPVLADVTSLGSWLDGADVVLGRVPPPHPYGRNPGRPTSQPTTRTSAYEPDFRSPAKMRFLVRRPSRNWLQEPGTMMNHHSRPYLALCRS